MPQRMKDYGRISSWRMYQTITTAGDLLEGSVSVPTAGTTNVLEMVTQNYKNVFVEGRNEDSTNTSDWIVYGTRKFNDTVPPTGNIFWDITEDHWEEVEATQANVATGTNIVPVEIVDKAYTYIVVNVTGDVAAVDTIARAIVTTF